MFTFVRLISFIAGLEVCKYSDALKHEQLKQITHYLLYNVGTANKYIQSKINVCAETVFITPRSLWVHGLVLVEHQVDVALEDFLLKSFWNHPLQNIAHIAWVGQGLLESAANMLLAEVDDSGVEILCASCGQVDLQGYGFETVCVWESSEIKKNPMSWLLNKHCRATAGLAGNCSTFLARV